MRIAMTGAHRVGKTSLAKELADALGMKLGLTGMSACSVWNDSGIKPWDWLAFAERCVVQPKLLTHLIDQYIRFDDESVDWIADRSPLDIFAYLMTNIDGTCSNIWTDAVDSLRYDVEFELACIDYIIVVQPGIVAEESEGKIGKVFLSEPYKEAINLSVIGSAVTLMDDLKKVIIIPREVTRLYDRVEYCIGKIVERNRIH